MCVRQRLTRPREEMGTQDGPSNERHGGQGLSAPGPAPYWMGAAVGEVVCLGGGSPLQARRRTCSTCPVMEVWAEGPHQDVSVSITTLPPTSGEEGIRCNFTSHRVDGRSKKWCAMTGSGLTLAVDRMDICGGRTLAEQNPCGWPQS